MWTRHSTLGVDKVPSGPYATHGLAMDPGGLATATTISLLASTTSQGGVVDCSKLHRIQVSTRNPFYPTCPWLFPTLLTKRLYPLPICALYCDGFLFQMKIEKKIPVEAIFFAHVQTVPGAHPSSCTMGSGSFTGCKAAGAWCWPPTPF
jgi:hypothetical protein